MIALPLSLVAMDAACDCYMTDETFRAAQVICSIKASVDTSVLFSAACKFTRPCHVTSLSDPSDIPYVGVGESLCFSLQRVVWRCVPEIKSSDDQ